MYDVRTNPEKEEGRISKSVSRDKTNTYLYFSVNSITFLIASNSMEAGRVLRYVAKLLGFSELCAPEQHWLSISAWNWKRNVLNYSVYFIISLITSKMMKNSIPNSNVIQK